MTDELTSNEDVIRAGYDDRAELYAIDAAAALSTDERLCAVCGHGRYEDPRHGTCNHQIGGSPVFCSCHLVYRGHQGGRGMRHHLLHSPPMGIIIYGGSWFVPLAWAYEERQPLILAPCFIAAIFLSATFGMVSALHMSRCAGTKEVEG